MNRRSSALIFTATVAFCFLLLGCGKHTDSRKPSAPTPPPGRKLRLAVVADSRSRSELAARAGCNRAVADLANITLDFQHLANPEAFTQKRIIDDLLARSTDGIAISPVDPDAQAADLAEAARQTLLFTQNNDAPNSGRACFVGTDWAAAGQQMAAVIRELLPEGGSVPVFVRPPDLTPPVWAWYSGLHYALDGEKYKVYIPEYNEGDLGKTLAAQPETCCFVGLTPDGGPALLRAMNAVSPRLSAKIVCCDAEPETLQGLRDGRMAASVVERPFEIGRQTILTMNRVLNGDRSAIPADGRLLVPCQVLRHDSVDAYVASVSGVPTH